MPGPTRRDRPKGFGIRQAWMFRGFGAIWMMLAATSCDRKANEVVHPTPENLPPRGSPVIRSGGTPIGLDSAALESWVSARDGLLSGWEVTAALGQRGLVGGDTPEVFGIETDLVVDGENIVILDRRNQAVKIFRRDGHYLGVFGRAGQGPGEFKDPAGIEVLADGRLVVLDRGQEIKIFSRTDSGYVYTGLRKIGLVPEYMCSVHDRVFVSGWRRIDDTMIHEVLLSDSATTERHFGRGYQSDHWLPKDQLSDGPVACVGDPLRVMFAFRRLPIVRAYTVDDGALLWTSRNEDYLQPPIVERRSVDGRPGINFSNRGARDLVASVTTVSSRHVLLQNVRFEPKPDPADVEHEVRSYLIDTATGQGAFISASLPLIAAVGRDYYVAKWMLPFPRIEIRVVQRLWEALEGL